MGDADGGGMKGLAFEMIGEGGSFLGEGFPGALLIAAVADQG